MSMLRAGVVGLGQMGGGAAICIARAGKRRLTVFDIDPCAALQWEGGDLVPPVAANCAEVARNADVVVVLVVDSAQVWSVLGGADGLLAGAAPGLVIVIASTIALEELEKMRSAAHAVGVTIVDCGVTCPPGAHHSKRIIGMVGAEPDVFERIREVLEDFTQAALLMGGPGAGMQTKIIRNMMYYASWAAAAQAQKLASRAGVDVAKMAQINQLSEADASGTTMWLRSFTAKDSIPGGGNALRSHVHRVMMKDLDAAAALADGYGISIPVIDMVRSIADDITSPWK
jgi:3-hydroxyisobutyrate dehydrogenase-like beta-hydroxyacid dehydrogenase